MRFARPTSLLLVLLSCVTGLVPKSASAQTCSGGPSDPNITGASGSVSVAGGSCVFISPTGAVAGQVRTNGVYTTTNQGSVTNPGGFGIRDTTNDTTVVNQSSIDALNGIDLRARSTVNNSGTIASTANAIRVRSNGTILHTGTINAGGSGLFADHDALVNSSGDITAGSSGIRVLDRGTVNSSSTIDAALYGIIGRNQTSVNAAGSITSGREAIRVQNNATVNNGASLMSGRIGIYVRNDSQVINTGNIQSASHGIYSVDRSTVSSSAAINAGGYGIFGRNQSQVNTAGSVTSVLDAIRLNNNAMVTNAAVIDSGRMGIYVRNDSAVSNVGNITSVSHGIFSQDRSTISTNAAIASGGYGIYGRNDATINAAGSIAAGRDGIRVAARGTVTSSADILTSRYGIIANNDAAVTNSGDINATRSGIQVSNRSVVASSGDIDAGQYGILARNQSQVAASGDIRSGLDGIRLGNNGQVRSSANIVSARRGIYANVNSQIESAGNVQSVHRALEVRDDSTIVNRGTAQSSSREGIFSRRRGSILNRGSAIGTIGIRGITDTQVVNSGRVVGTSGTAIQFTNGTNALTLQTGTRISGDVQGGSGSDSLFLEGSGSYGGRVLAFESLVRRGSGVWALGGNSTIAGPVQISGGTLQVDGILDAASFTVDRRGTLSGFGTVVPTVDVAGSIAPGTDGRVGTLTVQGDVNFSSRSQLRIDLTPRGSDLLSVGGAANLKGGTVVVQPEPGSYRDGDYYDVLIAQGGRTGQFRATETLGSAVLRFDTLHLRDRVRLILARLPYAGLAGLTPNQNVVAQTLDGVVTQGGKPAVSISSKLDFLSEREIAQAFTALDPEPVDAYPELVDHWTELRFDTITRRLRDAYRGETTVGLRLGDPTQVEPRSFGAARGLPPVASDGESTASEELPPVSQLAQRPALTKAPGVSVWAYGLGLFGDKRSSVDVTGYDFDGGGAMVGADLPLSERFRVGAAFTWQDTDVRFDRRGARGRIQNQGLAVYGSFESGGPLFAEWALQHLWNEYETSRRITFPGVNRRATSSHEGRVLAAQASVGVRADWEGVSFEPRIGLRYARLNQDAFTEEGAGDLNLRLKGRRNDGLENFVGLRIARNVKIADSRLEIAPEIHGEWSREWLQTNRDIDASFVGLGNAAFTVHGDSRAREEWSTGVGVVATVNERLRFELQYDFQKGRDHVRSHAILGGVKFSF